MLYTDKGTESDGGQHRSTAVREKTRPVTVCSEAGLTIVNLEIVREGDSIILRPVRPTRGSFTQQEKADTDFMVEREGVVSDERRFNL